MFSRIVAPFFLLLFLFFTACTPSGGPKEGVVGLGGAANQENTNTTPQSTPPVPTATPMGGTIECPSGKSECAGLTNLAIVFVSKNGCDGAWEKENLMVSMKGHVSQIKYGAVVHTEGDEIKANPNEVNPVAGMEVRFFTPPSSSTPFGPYTTNSEGCFVANFPANPHVLAKFVGTLSGNPALILDNRTLEGLCSKQEFPPCGPPAEQASDPSQ